MIDDQQQLTKLANAIVEVHRRAFTSVSVRSGNDFMLEDGMDALWKEQQKLGVDWQTFRAAKDLALPRTAEVFLDWTQRMHEAGLRMLRRYRERQGSERH